MKGQFVLALAQLECLGRLGSGIEIVSGLRLVDDPRRIECLRNPGFGASIGNIELKYLQTAKLLFCTDVQEFGSIAGPEQVSNLLAIIDSYLDHLWLLEEHTAYYDRGYLLEDTGSTHSNTRLSATYDWKGQRRGVQVSRKVLEIAKHFLRTTAGSLPESYKLAPERIALLHGETLASRNVQLESRFMVFSRYARQAADPGLRIALTCSALEVLFATGTSELTHRVSERVAFLLRSNGNERRQIYATVKKLYGIRSIFVHGDSLKKADEPNIADRVRDADQILREVAQHLYTDEKFAAAVAQGKDALDECHTNLLFL